MRILLLGCLKKYGGYLFVAFTPGHFGEYGVTPASL